MLETMRLIAALLLALAALSPALAQVHPAGLRPHPMGPLAQHPMPPPERRMGWEERQRLREQVRNGQMTRDEARARWREQRAADPHRFSREQHEQLRRDVQEANREIRRGR
jgi:hypothetical protein